jgi:hypothetical protein
VIGAQTVGGGNLGLNLPISVCVGPSFCGRVRVRVRA